MDDILIGTIFKIIGVIFFIFCIVFVIKKSTGEKENHIDSSHKEGKNPRNRQQAESIQKNNRQQIALMEIYIELTRNIAKLASNGCWDEVLEKCNYGINKFPDRTIGLLNFRGRAWFKKLKNSITAYNNKEEIYLYYNNSLADYSSRIKEFPDSAHDIYARGLLFIIKGNLKDAMADFNEVKKIDAKYLAGHSNFKSILDDFYTGRLLLAVAFGMHDFFQKREEMYKAGYKYQFSMNSNYIIDPEIIYAIPPEFERDIIANMIEAHNKEKINVTRRFDFALYEQFMYIVKIKDDYLDRYFELKIYDMLDMLTIIYGDITDDECDKDLLIKKIFDMMKINLW